MEKEDPGSQAREQLHARRKQVIRLRQKGHRIMEIVELTGLSHPTVRNAITLYEQGGTGALKPRSAGRQVGTRRRLSAEQEQALQKAIGDQRPEQLKMALCLWSRVAVMPLIKRKLRHPADGACHWQLSCPLGLHPAKADQKGL